MTLQQLRALVAVFQSELNVTAAAARLRTTQPVVSKHLRLLEEELGFKLFVRRGRALAKITPGGERVLGHALELLRQVQQIREISRQHESREWGSLSLGTTHTEARYVLPGVIQRFRTAYPKVQVHLHQGTAEQIADMIRLGRIDLAVVAGSQDVLVRCLVLPCYLWRHRVIVPPGHLLAGTPAPSVEQLSRVPLVASEAALVGPSSLYATFSRANLTPELILTAQSADVIKTYVRLGLGAGLIAEMALDESEDPDLVALDASHLLPAHTTWIGLPGGGVLRRYTYDFLSLLAPHLTRELIARASRCRTQRAVEELIADVRVPAWQAMKSAAGSRPRLRALAATEQ